VDHQGRDGDPGIVAVILRDGRSSGEVLQKGKKTIDHGQALGGERT
jgi:hypothetical protein